MNRDAKDNKDEDRGLKYWAGKLWVGVASVVAVAAGVATVASFLWPGTVNDLLNALLESNQQLEKSVSEVKKETSDDFIKELSNRNYKLEKRDFARAILAEDLKSVELFCAAGKKDWLGDRDVIFDIEYDGAVFNALKDCNAFDMGYLCSMEMFPYFDWDDEAEKVRKGMAYTAMCGPNALSEISARIAGDENAQAADDLAICEDYRTSLMERMAADQYFSIQSFWFFRDVMRNSWKSDALERCASLGIDFKAIYEAETAQN